MSTRHGELDRTVYLINQINNEQGLYFVLIFLVDAGYDRNDIIEITERMPAKNKVIGNLNVRK